MVYLKSDRELVSLRKAGRLAARILAEISRLVEPGIATGEIDRVAEARCKEMGALPAFKGYHGFPASVCISLNDEVVHGIPSPKRKLIKGDLISLDFGVLLDGWYGDCAMTVVAGGRANLAQQKLMEATKESLRLGIDQCKVGNRLFDIGFAIQNYVEGCGYSVVREFVGHGIGRALHEDPQVPNFGPKGKGMVLQAGMVLAIEPMVNAGGHEVKVLGDGWTAVTVDHSLSAHFEHTIAITDKGPEVLTILEE